MAHLHGVVDADKHFVIDAATREITNQSDKITLMQNDHNSERFTFEIPREIDGHDMSLCNVVRIHYLNIDTTTKAQNPGFYEVEDLQISPDDDSVIIGSWLVSSNATKNVGSLNFTIRFKCVNDDGVIEYAWSSAIFKGISIGQSYNNTGTVAEEYADIFLQWQARIEALEQGGNSSEAPLVFYCTEFYQGSTTDIECSKEEIYPQEIEVRKNDYIVVNGGLYIVVSISPNYYRCNKLADICGNSDEETIFAEQINYTNENLQDKSGTVKAALDEAIGFVVSDLPDLVAKKHSHENKDTLDKLTTSEEGELLFEGLPIQSNSEQNQISAEDVAYENPNLQDKSGTVKGALDEAVGFVTGELSNIVTNLAKDSHSHNNKGVLDKFGENESGELIYNGKSMTQNYKTVEITEGGLTSNQLSPGHYIIGTFNKVLPENIKIKEIRIVDNNGNIKRLVDMGDGLHYPIRIVTYLDNKYDEVVSAMWTLAYIYYPGEMDDNVYEGMWVDRFFVDYYEA